MSYRSTILSDYPIAYYPLDDLTTVDFSNNISLISGSRLTVSQNGVYDIQFSAQLDKTNSSNAVAYIWLSKNGTDIANTNTGVTLSGGSNDKVVAAWNWFVSGNAGDYWEIRYAADDNNVIFPYDTPGSGLGPTVPSWIVTMNKIT
jgi:thiamine pyrophosphokinase